MTNAPRLDASRARRVVWAAGAAAAVGATASSVFAPQPVGWALAHGGMILAAAIAVHGTWRAALVRPSARGPWIFLTLASASCLASQLLLGFYALPKIPKPEVGPADGLWWSFTVLAAIALSGVSLPGAGRRLAALESLALALGAAAAIVVVFQPAALNAPVDGATRLVAVGYPLAYACAGIIALQVLAVRSDMRRDRGFVLVALALLLHTLTFLAWAPKILDGAQIDGTGIRTIGWSVGLVALGAAGLLSPPAFPAGDAVSHRWRGALPLTSFVVATVALGYATLAHHPREIRLLLLGAVCAAGAALGIRAWLLARRQVALLEEQVASAAELREAHAQQRLVLDAAGEGIWGIDVEGRIAFMNRSAVKILGFGHAEAVGADVHDLVHRDAEGNESHSRAACPLRIAVTSGRYSYTEAETFRRRDGSSCTVGFGATPIDDGDGSSGAVVVFRDVTSEILADAQLRQAQRLESIGMLAGGVAHDFNNILMAVSAYVGLARTAGLRGEPVEPYLSGIEDAAGRGSAVTDQLLAFGRQHTVEASIVSLDDVVRDCDLLLERLVPENLPIAIAFELEANAHVEVDVAKLGQVLMNLVVNARDAMPSGGRVTISTSRAIVDGRHGRPVPPGSYAVLGVRDSGTGMSPETVERIFEPFFTTKAPGEGTGLGLATVFGIVKQSSGHIFVDSEEGVGTSFEIYLPVVDAAVAAPPAPPKSAPGLHRTATILLVEDEPILRTLLAEVLREAGHRVLVAGDGDEGQRIGLAAESPLDLIVTDVSLPGRSGTELVEAIRAVAPSVLTIFMSGSTDDAVAGRGWRESERFLQKPFELERLPPVVAELLDERERGDAAVV